MTQPIIEIRSGQQERTSRRAILRGFAGGAATAAFLAAGWTVEAASPPAFTIDGATNGSVGSPLNIVFLFGRPSDPDAFEDYYSGTHIPMALKMPLFKRLEGCKALSDANGGAPSFYRIATFSYASRDDMVSSITSAEGLAAFADVLNFATGGVTATIVQDIHVMDAGSLLPSAPEDPRTPY